MRRILPILLALPLMLGATYYVDLACPTAGNGTSATCSASPTTNNPKNTMDAGVALLTTAGDILNVRGIHATHDNCPGSTHGRYTGVRNVSISGKTGNGGAHIIIQCSGWTAINVGTEEICYIEGIGASGSGPTLGWTQCSDCASGTCLNVPGVCNEVWWTDLNAAGHPSGMTRNVAAVRPDGKPTYRETSVANIDQQWDSYSNNSTTAILFVRWGTGNDAPGGSANPMPYVFFDAGAGFDVKGSSDYVEIRGFKVRNQTSGGLYGSGGADHLYFIDNSVQYVGDRAGNGSDRPVTLISVAHATIESNDVSCSGSEAIHTQAAGTAGAPVTTVLDIKDNYLHDLGQYCASTLGPQVQGSPAGAILGDSSDNGSGGVGAGDYTGSKFRGNLIQRVQRNGGSHASCWALENNSSGWQIHDNVCDTIGGSNGNDRGIELVAGCGAYSGNPSCAANAVNSNEFWNNIIRSVPGPCIKMEAVEQSQTANSNKFFNITCIDTGGGLTYVCDGGGCASNLAKNLILSHTGNQQLVNVPNTAGVSNVLLNTLVFSATKGAADTGLATWRGTAYSCNTITDIDASMACAAPVFANPGGLDYHIQTSSPAKNAGTATGMPTGRTTDISNALAVLHGLADYADAEAIQGGTWDMGADEYAAAAAPTRPGAIVVSSLRQVPRCP